MGGATIWPVPRALDAEAHYYPRLWKRNLIFLYGGLFLIGIQVQRYGLLCKVSSINHCFISDIFHSNRRCARENTWTGEVEMLPSVLDSTEYTLIDIE